MNQKPRRIHRPRQQTSEQEAAERSLRGRIQKERPRLSDLVAHGDLAHVYTMGEYWDLRKTFAALKALREERGLSITDLAKQTGMDRAMISRLENGRLDNPTLGTVNRYARALGKRVVVRFQEATEPSLLDLLARMVGCSIPSLRGKSYTVVEVVPGEHVKLRGRKRPSVLPWDAITRVYEAACEGVPITPTGVDRILRNQNNWESSTMCALVLAMREQRRILVA